MINWEYQIENTVWSINNLSLDLYVNIWLESGKNCFTLHLPMMPD